MGRTLEQLKDDYSELGLIYNQHFSKFFIFGQDSAEQGEIVMHLWGLLLTTAQKVSTDVTESIDALDDATENEKESLRSYYNKLIVENVQQYYEYYTYRTIPEKVFSIIFKTFYQIATGSPDYFLLEDGLKVRSDGFAGVFLDLVSAYQHATLRSTNLKKEGIEKVTALLERNGYNGAVTIWKDHSDLLLCGQYVTPEIAEGISSKLRGCLETLLRASENGFDGIKPLTGDLVILSDSKLWVEPKTYLGLLQELNLSGTYNRLYDTHQDGVYNTVQSELSFIRTDIIKKVCKVDDYLGVRTVTDINNLTQMLTEYNFRVERGGDVVTYSYRTINNLHLNLTDFVNYDGLVYSDAELDFMFHQYLENLY